MVIQDGTNKGWSLTVMECPWRNGLPSNGPVCPREGGMFPLEPYWKKMRTHFSVNCILIKQYALSKILSHKCPGML